MRWYRLRPQPLADVDRWRLSAQALSNSRVGVPTSRTVIAHPVLRYETTGGSWPFPVGSLALPPTGRRVTFIAAHDSESEAVMLPVMKRSTKENQ